MAETYCGKSCAECTSRGPTGCPGCKAGPARQFCGDCEIAKCATGKGHETCDSCTFQGNCRLRQSRDQQPEFRQKRADEERRRQENLAQRSPILGQGLWTLFWLMVVGFAADLLTQDFVQEGAPGVYLVGEILSVIIVLLRALVVLRLGTVEDRYRTAGICMLIVAVLNMVEPLIGSRMGVLIDRVLGLAVVVLGLVWQYQLMQGHSNVLLGVDDQLAQQWRNLWNWYVGSFAALFVSPFVMMLIPFLGFLILLAALVAVIVVAIREYILLYRTAQLFRAYTLQ